MAFITKERMMEEAPDDPVRVIGIVAEEVGMPRNDGSPGSALYAVPIRLSRTPSAEWSSLFVEIWNHPPRFTAMHRPGIAHVVDDTIILDGTTLEEVEQYHKDTLKLVIEDTTRKVGELHAVQRGMEESEKEKKRQHRDAVAEAVKRIKFE